MVFRKSRERSTILSPRQVISSRLVSVTSATTVASKFSSAASAVKASMSPRSMTTAILSCDSEIASSVPSRPSYFFGTLSKSIFSPSASSPMATETPPAPKSLQRLIILATVGLRNRRCSLRSVGALPFCTSAPQVSILMELCALEEPVAPPQPSLPVLPPSRIITSPFSGRSRFTFSLGEAPITAPISIRLAT